MNNLLKCSVGYMIEFVVSIINIYILGRILENPIDYGKYSYLELIISYGVILLGLGKINAFIRYYYDKNFISKAYLLKSCLKNSIYLFWALFLLLCCLIYLFELPDFYLLALVFSFITILNNYILEILKFEEKSFLFSIMKATSKVTLSLFLCIFYIFSIKISYINIYILNFIILSLYLFFIYFIFLKKWYLNNQVKIKLEKKQEEEISSQLFKYSYPYIFNNLISIIFVSADKIYILYFLDESKLGIYSMGYRVIGLLSAIYIIYSGIFTPVILKKYYELSEENVKEILKEVNEIISFFLILIGLIYCGTSNFLLKFVITKSYEESILISDLLIFGPIFNTIGLSVFFGIILKEKPKYHLLISIYSSILSIILNFILGSYFGIKGVALATSIVWIVFYFLCKYYSNKLFYVRYNLFNINIGIIFIYSIIISKIYFSNSLSQILIVLIYICVYLFISKRIILKIIQKIIKFSN